MLFGMRINYLPGQLFNEIDQSPTLFSSSRQPPYFVVESVRMSSRPSPNSCKTKLSIV